ncbi:hypothetical protein Mgra_00009730 [Meloidogyne graminicola]|uniref:Uncharacterized protein n=1 Tax=Meloidogyne graminicola TaxID=189291 RepID=A0A8S9Z729_9BILA|nr:hypothetical protein Mgra_00009730 [Meloidogyne graminicola]
MLKSHQKNKQFLFPRWRSVDPLTASLVASMKTIQIIPNDSIIPEHREEKLINTEKKAKMDKVFKQKYLKII